MFYRVKAKLKTEKAAEFLDRLRDGTISEQKLDGQEIVDSMHRAVMNDDEVMWSEKCFCPTPLKHERETVLDFYFDDLTTETLQGYEDYEGDSFMEYLVSVAK
ncbi:hypothetical protein KS4_24980 [Poriferisphaera corsica]|uniref:Uncharacterized protein n=1 Tax=Poriferisphaera corsica TaxID=2528020 RepID=A0A517YW29_9BACT|nr:hypothetical protein [Poriferisphaera corsica]QDU34428.1 hypothetical protein KS4_24980 [Poriferisphaera corsica]